MAETKHTPGPWSLHTDHRMGYDRQVTTWYIRDAKGLGIAVQPAFSDDAAAEANFRLIAAAPAMLEALRDLIAWRDTEFSAPGTWETARNLIAALSGADATEGGVE